MAREQRRLAAIVAADVVGYSRLMGRDESGTLSRLREHRIQRFEPTLARHGGRLVKLTGDGALAEFPSAVDALSAAIEFQQLMTDANRGHPEDERIVFRIGLHLGDLIVDGSDLYGDGVNVAARLEAEAPPGGVVISGNVYDAIAGRLKATFHDLGNPVLKNIDRPVRAFGVEWNAEDWQTQTQSLAASALTDLPLTLPDKPSIAVLPFQNMSGDPEQEYFADGVVEDILTALSRVTWLFVIARNSSFTYKGRAVDVKQVGRELGVRYVLEGSIRKSANRLRITGQLIDAATGGHLWAQRFEGGLEDIFELQDKVTASVVGAIAPKLEQAEIVRATRKPTESLDAYDYYLRGRASWHKGFAYDKGAIDEALLLFYRAIELDPEFSAAYGMAAWCHVQRRNYGWVHDDGQETAEARRLAEQAVRLGNEDAVALYTGGFGLTMVAGQLQTGAALIDRALALDPNLAAAWNASGWVRIYLGDAEIAIEHLARAMRLNPVGPEAFTSESGTAAAHFLAGRYTDALKWSEKALQTKPNYAPAMRMVAASYACVDRLTEAQQTMARMRQFDPDLCVANLAGVVPFRSAAAIARYTDSLRRAGLPE